MSNVLLIYDDIKARLSVEVFLATLSIYPIHLILEEFDAEFFQAETFDLIIFDLSRANHACMTILQQLEKLAATSGTDHPPVIVVAEQSLGLTEQTLRTAKASFFFVKPFAEGELTAAIQHSLQHPTSP